MQLPFFLTRCYFTKKGCLLLLHQTLFLSSEIESLVYPAGDANRVHLYDSILFSKLSVAACSEVLLC